MHKENIKAMRLAKYLMVVLFLTGVAFGQQGRMAGRRGMMAGGQFQKGGFDALKDYLKLTPQQVSDLQGIQASMRESVGSLARDLAPKVRALRDAMRQDPVDSATVSRLRKEIEDARGNIRAKRDEFGARARAVLTSEQAASLQALEQALAVEREARQAVRLGLIAPPVN